MVGRGYHLQIATADVMDLTPFESLGARNAAVDGVMYDPTHVSISFRPATPVGPIAAAMLRHCTDGLPANLALTSARRSLDGAAERLVFVLHDARAAKSLLHWAGEYSIPIATVPPERPLASAGADWARMVFHESPATVVLACARRRGPG